MKSIILSIILSFLSFSLLAQQSNTSQQINEDIYIPFSKSYETKDVDLFASLQSEDLIRIVGDGKKITSKAAYIDGIANWWKNSNNTLHIDFRFIERIANELNASERGVYKITFNQGTNDESFSYGKFHVILERIDGVWKFIVDYDSSEDNTIREEEFQAASAM